VGLLNIGEEAEKGNEQTRGGAPAADRGRPRINFVGNVEGRDIIAGKCDVVVCDGFVGNVLLKFYESVASFIAKLLLQEMQKQRMLPGPVASTAGSTTPNGEARRSWASTA
jgi:phosphate acyltransferase